VESLFCLPVENGIDGRPPNVNFRSGGCAHNGAYERFVNLLSPKMCLGALEVEGFAQFAPAVDCHIQIVVGYENLDADVIGAGIEMLLNPINRDV
jgi:hypothetical protein